VKQEGQTGDSYTCMHAVSPCLPDNHSAAAAKVAAVRRRHTGMACTYSRHTHPNPTHLTQSRVSGVVVVGGGHATSAPPLHHCLAPTVPPLPARCIG
jgi:hypothetical protein